MSLRRAQHESRFDFPNSCRSPRDEVQRALQSLGWPLLSLTSKTIEARIPGSMSSFGEHFVVEFLDDRSTVLRSQCQRFQLGDWGKNRQNIEAFLLTLNNGLQVKHDPRTTDSDHFTSAPLTLHRAMSEPGNIDLEKRMLSIVVKLWYGLMLAAGLGWTALNVGLLYAREWQDWGYYAALIITGWLAVSVGTMLGLWIASVVRRI